MAKKFTYRGKELEELQKMSLEDFSKLLTTRMRRSLLKGFNEKEKKFLEKLRKAEKPVRTHCRQIVIIPEMVGKQVMIHNGKDWNKIEIKMEMLGHRLGEFSLTRARTAHSTPTTKKKDK
jgi:small subunit ribosomal protein S19